MSKWEYLAIVAVILCLLMGLYITPKMKCKALAETQGFADWKYIPNCACMVKPEANADWIDYKRLIYYKEK